jgi:hypothetical protein
MVPNPERRRHPRTKSLPDQRELTIICQAGKGRSMMAAKLLDFSEEGMCVEIKSQLSEGSLVEIVGEITRADGPQPLDRLGFVRRCVAAENGRFVAGVFLRRETTKTTPNYYEFLQISPNAEPDTISRVYRFLASRYHPDIPETGDADKFVLLKQAYDVLTDPERRAEYDATYKKQAREPVPLSNSVDFMSTSDGELNRRVAVLALLYFQRRITPITPEVSLVDVERRMGFPRDYLDFTMWYLKSKGYITIADNSDFAITARGVDLVESNREKIPLLNKLLSDRTGSSSTTEGVAGSKPLIMLGENVLELPANGVTEPKGIYKNRDDKV